ncbi:hypothetical protein Sya03_23530 [Spirilliplanes yamanashiensis]|uniref:Alpha-1,6-mannosyltransferase n=1 Tax=Spirilliplanes yamanashiensis TaxID=42233 RepID=A0A8J3Y6X7_9ACTN|nr:hypothetical protein Sya03_23530 [Spirilliplanes yamanashiensis]
MIAPPVPVRAARPAAHAPAGRFGLARWGGFAAAAVLAAVTSGVPLPGLAVTAGGLLAMAGVAAAWLALGAVAATVPVRRLVAVAALWASPLLISRPLFSGDVWSYLAQGLIVARGQDPYTLGPAQALGADSAVTRHVSPYWMDTPAPYGPGWEALSGLVGRLTGEHLAAGVLLYRLVAVAGVLMIAWALPRLARRAGVPASRAVWLGLLNPLVLWHLVTGVHNDALMLGLLLAGVELVLAGAGLGAPAAAARVVAGFGLITLAANVKVVAAGAGCVLAVHLARRHRRPALTLLLAAGGGAALTVAICLGTGLGFGWIEALGSSSGVHSWLAPTNQVGFLIGGAGSLAGADLTAGAIHAARTAGAVAGAAGAGWVLWRVYRGRTDPLRGIGLLFAVMVVCGPVLHPWYVLWAILPLAASARSVREVRRLAGVSVVLAVALPPAGHGVAALAGGYALAALVVAAAVPAYRLLSARPAPLLAPLPA